MAAERNSPDAAAYGLPLHVECPFCLREDATELYNAFGPQLSVASYWCSRCYTAFDFLKWRPGTGNSGV